MLTQSAWHLVVTMTSPSNPYDVCTWRPTAACEGCDLAGRLKCRFDRRHLLHFMGTFSLFAIPAFVGVIRIGDIFLGAAPVHVFATLLSC